MTSLNKSDLIYKLSDGDITDIEFQQLQELMRTDPEVKEMYYDIVLLEHSLNDLMGEQVLSPVSRRVKSVRPSVFRRHMKIGFVAAAACLFVGLMVGYFIPSEPVPVVAEMRFSANTTWSINGESGANVDELTVGDLVSIDSGAVELKLPHGVVAIVEGPSSFELKDERELSLYEGRGSFIVPKEGVGFTVTTPSFKAVDLGTEFGVVTGWGDEDQVHVLKGAVNVANGESVDRTLYADDAVAVNKEGDVWPVDCEERLFHTELPSTTRVIAWDDFESGFIKDDLIRVGDLDSWERTGSAQGDIVGKFNPRGVGRFYTQPKMVDDGEGSGSCKGMKGPNVAYFFGPSDVGLKRQVGKIAQDCLYTATFHLGVRGIDQQFAGYTISLQSGDSVLHSISSSEAPGDRNTFNAVSLSWDSAKLPVGVNVEDQISVHITPYPHKTEAKRYLDFDNFRMTGTQRVKK